MTADKQRSGRHAASPELEHPPGSAPRRTGRHAASTPSATPVDDTDAPRPAPRTAPAPRGRATGRSSTTPAPASAPARRRTGPDPRTGTGARSRSRFAPGSAGGASRLRTRPPRSLKEASDDEGAAASDTSASDLADDGPLDYESEVDDTVYFPSADASLPAEAVVRPAAPPAGTGGAEAPPPPPPRVAVPSAALGDLLSAYALLRSFSWQLRLAPFPFEDLCAAMASPQPTQVMDEVHTCVLRALAADETPAERGERRQDLALLDNMTWPCFAWEFLRLTEEPLAAHEWAQRAKGGRPPPRPLPPPRPPPKAGAGAAAHAAQDAPASPAAAQGEAAAPTPPPPPPPPPPPARVEAFSPVDAGAMDAAMAAAAAAPAELTAAEVFAERQPRPPAPQPEYYSLPVEVKAAVLSRLCDHLLDCTTFRAEIDRREGGALFVSGRGGEGGAFAVMTPEEKRRAEARAARQQQSDANTDTCVLCGLGGNLLCCDSCPAAYHMRCLGETAKTLGEGDWACPECVVGGRGETAGLRVPVAARNKWKQPHHLINGALVRSELPPVRSRGRHAAELDCAVPAALLTGAAAAEALAAAHRVRSADELPLHSSYEMVEDPPAWPADAAGAGPEGYANRYRNGWLAAAGAVRATVEEAKRRKHKGGIWVPTGTCGRLVVPELPAPLPVSRFQWVQLQGRPVGRLTARCGKCHTCLRKTLRKGCMNPVPRAGGDDAAAAAAESSK
jgi:hypothetical protein